jgi:hypothetical protein
MAGDEDFCTIVMVDLSSAVAKYSSHCKKSLMSFKILEMRMMKMRMKMRMKKPRREIHLIFRQFQKIIQSDGSAVHDLSSDPAG